MILVIGSVVAKSGEIDRALSLSREHVLRSRQEPGCVAHAVHRDAENPDRLVFVEEWVDQAALSRHFQVPESRAFARALAMLAAEPPAMSVYEAAKVRV